MNTQRLKEVLTNGTGSVTYKVFVTTLATVLLALATLIGGMGTYVMAQHTSTPHPVTSTKIEDAKKEVKDAVKETEDRLTAQQVATDVKINQILFLMVQQAERSDSQ